MARRGWTTKPCPNCGTTGGRPTDKLCNDCQKLIREAETTREFHRQQRGYVVRRHWPSPAHWNPNYCCAAGHEEEDRLARAMADLVGAVAEPASDSTSEREAPFLLDRRGYDGTYRMPKLRFRSPVAEAFAELDAAIVSALDSARRRGFQEGSNLLQRFAAGDLSPNGFQEARTRAEEDEEF